MCRSEKGKELKEEAISQWGQIGRRVFEQDIPSFKKVWNDVLTAGTSCAADHPLAVLYQYVNSLNSTCQQCLYSLERLKSFSTKEASNVFEFYVSHYIYDFFSRVKTTTDLLALIVNHVFEFGLYEKECRLERGRLAAAINERCRIDTEDQQIRQLRSNIESARNRWVRVFEELRNLTIHRGGLRFVGMGVPDAGECRIHINNFAGGMMHIADEHRILRALLPQIGMTAASQYQTIDPVRFCDGLWSQLSSLVENILNDCEKHILAFISSKRNT